MSVSVGNQVACAIKAALSVVCWGKSGGSPKVQVPSSLGLAVSISVSKGQNGQSVCALQTNSEMLCWNYKGEITVAPSLIARSIASGQVSCLITADSQVECFAPNGAAVRILKNPGIVRAVSVGSSHLYGPHWVQFACAITATEELSCWDEDGYPQEAIKGEVLAVSVNGYYGCALLKDRTVTVWQFTQDAPKIEVELSRKDLRFKYDNE
jgi:hypothetical protein